MVGLKLVTKGDGIGYLKRLVIGFIAVVILSAIVTYPATTFAATVNPAPVPKVSFTFDDGYANALTKAAPTLAKYGIKGTNYVITDCVGKATTICVDGSTGYMSWAQINSLKNTYGWEIGSHTRTHPLLTGLTAAQVEDELATSKSALASYGINATAFAAPYGDYNPAVLSAAAKHYTSLRGFADVGYNTWPNSDYLIRTQQLHGGVTVATVKGWVDQAIANKQWLVLTFHDIKDRASTRPDYYEYSNSKLDQIAAYVKLKNVATPTVSQGIVSGTNIYSDGGFTAGLGNWTTDSPTNVVADAFGNGDYSGVVNAVKLTATTKNIHLFAPKTAIDPLGNYIFKTFLSVKQLTSGEVAFYIDEYDASGNWISGQYKGAERSVWTESFNFSYQPTSVNVASAGLQIIVTANSNIVAYIDNARLIKTN